MSTERGDIINKGKKIGIGVLGCSDIARRRFLPAVLRTGSVELTAIASREIETARAFHAGGVHRAETYDQLLEDPDVDLVYISLPNHLHEEWTLKALNARKHVICEKPLGLTYSSVMKMVAAARERDLLLYENIMYLNHPRHHLVRELTRSGMIGTVRCLTAAFGFQLASMDGFRTRPEQGGGSFHDQARYPLSAALFFLTGNTYRFTGFSRFRGGLNIGMTASAETSAGERFSFSIGFDRQYECWYEITGDTGTIRVDRAFTTPADLDSAIEIKKGRERRSIMVPAADHFQAMIEHVCTLIEEKNYAPCLSDAAHLALLAEQVSSRCEKVVVGQ